MKKQPMYFVGLVLKRVAVLSLSPEGDPGLADPELMQVDEKNVPAEIETMTLRVKVPRKYSDESDWKAWARRPDR